MKSPENLYSELYSPAILRILMCGEVDKMKLGEKDIISKLASYVVPKQIIRLTSLNYLYKIFAVKKRSLVPR